MRIRILHQPTVPSIDGIQLDRFQPGFQYEVGNLIGAVMLAEGWAEPVASEEAAVLIPFSDFTEAAAPPTAPPNLIREIFPSYYDGPVALSNDRRRKRRVRRT